ncbi:MAG: alkaline phosphatase, partial [Dysgonamonadaceae bacterium]|nr:alkaline phosphatase [Dysgonamonadaceae bacterium]
MNRKMIFIVLLCGVCCAVQSQTFTVNKNAHSHNDYLNNQPFHDAYSNRFASIETDIFLVDGNLYVAHTPDEINKNLTFKTLYLNPLLEQIRLNGGKAYPDGSSLQLLIDVKTNGEPTLRALEKLLQPVREYFDTEQNKNAVRLVISGNMPTPARFKTFDRIFLFDGRSNISYSDEQMKRIAFYSAPLSAFSNWNGLGRFPEKELLEIRAFVDSIHAFGKKVRFWGNPDTKTCWQAFIKLGVDYINTDHPYELARFLNEYAQSSYRSDDSYRPYSSLPDGENIRKKTKNVILLISDGAGFSEIWAAATANRGALNVMNCQYTGFLQTHSADDYNTDSAAAGTAIATGKKTRNRHIGVDSNGIKIKNIVELLSEKGVSCGIVSNDHIAGATPAAFYAHCSERNHTDSILSYLLHTPATLVVADGGDMQNAKMQELSQRLEKSGRIVCEKIDSLEKIPHGRKAICFDRDSYDTDYRLIEKAFDKCVKRLECSEGFFLMIEGAKIDKGGHSRNIKTCIDEYLSFDRVVGKAMEFADSNGETLVIVTSDHETGGLVLLDGNYHTGFVLGEFITNDHTGMPVPLFAYGQGADSFTGFMDNTELSGKIISMMQGGER